MMPPKKVTTPDSVRNKAQELRAKMAQQREEAAALKEYFSSLFPEEFMVTDAQFGVWIRQYGFDNAVLGFEEAARKMNMIGQQVEEKAKDDDGEPVVPMGKSSLIKFASWVMAHPESCE